MSRESPLLRIERVVLTVWVSCLWGVGYLAVPTLFRGLDDRRLAGTLAGEMFSIVSLVGIFSAIILLVLAWQHRTEKPMREWRLWVLISMLILTLVGRFVLQPMIVDLRVQGLVEGSDIARSFGILHGISSLLFLATSVLAAVLVIAGPRPTNSDKAV